MLLFSFIALGDNALDLINGVSVLRCSITFHEWGNVRRVRKGILHLPIIFLDKPYLGPYLHLVDSR